MQKNLYKLPFYNAKKSIQTSILNAKINTNLITPIINITSYKGLLNLYAKTNTICTKVSNSRQNYYIKCSFFISLTLSV